MMDQSLGAGVTVGLAWKGGDIETSSSSYKHAERACNSLLQS